MRRGKNSKDTKDSKWWYPLRDWKWDREECEKQILAAGLPVPMKSCCFFCPAMKPEELTQLAKSSPDLVRRAIAIEDGAQARQEVRRAEGKKAILGLWGMGTKGVRVAKKPGAWREYIEANFPDILKKKKGNG
jgi:ABC-type branched-subunit amino acid transport system substrate-binding protein